MGRAWQWQLILIVGCCFCTQETLSGRHSGDSDVLSPEVAAARVRSVLIKSAEVQGFAEEPTWGAKARRQLQRRVLKSRRLTQASSTSDGPETATASGGTGVSADGVVVGGAVTSTIPVGDPKAQDLLLTDLGNCSSDGVEPEWAPPSTLPSLGPTPDTLQQLMGLLAEGRAAGGGDGQGSFGWQVVDLQGRVLITEDDEQVEFVLQSDAQRWVLRNGSLQLPAGGSLRISGAGEVVLHGLSISRQGHAAAGQGQGRSQTPNSTVVLDSRSPEGVAGAGLRVWMAGVSVEARNSSVWGQSEDQEHAAVAASGAGLDLTISCSVLANSGAAHSLMIGSNARVTAAKAVLRGAHRSSVFLSSSSSASLHNCSLYPVEDTDAALGVGLDIARSGEGQPFAELVGCDFVRAYAAVRSLHRDASVTVASSRCQECNYGVLAFSNITLRDSTFTGKAGSSEVGLVVSGRDSYARVERSTMSGFGTGALLMLSRATAEAQDCTLVSGLESGMILRAGNRLKLDRCRLVGNTGVTIANDGGFVELQNCTLEGSEGDMFVYSEGPAASIRLIGTNITGGFDAAVALFGGSLWMEECLLQLQSVGGIVAIGESYAELRRCGMHIAEAVSAVSVSEGGELAMTDSWVTGADSTVFLQEGGKAVLSRVRLSEALRFGAMVVGPGSEMSCDSCQVEDCSTGVAVSEGMVNLTQTRITGSTEIGLQVDLDSVVAVSGGVIGENVFGILVSNSSQLTMHGTTLRDMDVGMVAWHGRTAVNSCTVQRMSMGFLVAGASAMIRNSSFSDNGVSAAMAVQGSDLELTDSVFRRSGGAPINTVEDQMPFNLGTIGQLPLGTVSAVDMDLPGPVGANLRPPGQAFLSSNLTVQRCDFLDGGSAAVVVAGKVDTLVDSSRMSSSLGGGVLSSVQQGYSFRLSSCSISGNEGGGVVVVQGVASLTNCTIVGNGQLGEAHGVHILQASSVFAADTFVGGSGASGFAADGRSSLAARNCTSRDNTGHGFFGAQDGTQLVLQNCLMKKNMLDGVRVEGRAEAILLHSDAVENVGSGISAEAASHLLVSEGNATHNRKHGVEVARSPVVELLNTQLSSNGRSGLSALQTSTDVVLQHCLLSSNNGSGAAVNGAVLGAVNSSFTNNTRHGLDALDEAQVNLTACVVDGNGGFGLQARRAQLHLVTSSVAGGSGSVGKGSLRLMEGSSAQVVFAAEACANQEPRTQQYNSSPEEQDTVWEGMLECPQDEDSGAGGGDSNGALIGGILGAVAAAAIIAAVTFVILRRRAGSISKLKDACVEPPNAIAELEPMLDHPTQESLLKALKAAPAEGAEAQAAVDSVTTRMETRPAQKTAASGSSSGGSAVKAPVLQEGEDSAYVAPKASERQLAAENDALPVANGKGEELEQGPEVLPGDDQVGQGLEVVSEPVLQLAEAMRLIMPVKEGFTLRVDLQKDFRWKERLGKGAFGNVYKAIWTAPNQRRRTVAVKLMDFGAVSEGRSRESLESIFYSELSIMARIDHPNIVKCYGGRIQGNVACLVLEYMDGGSLDSYIQKIHRQSPPQKKEMDMLSVFWQLANALEYLHPVIVHADIKPANVLLDSSGHCKLADFGLSKAIVRTSLTRHTAGTRPYSSPEVLLGKRVTEATDIFSMAVLMWEMAACQRPWQGYGDLEILGAVAWHGERLPIPDSCPEPLQQLITRMWHHDASLRPSARDVLLKLCEQLKQPSGRGA